MVNYVCNVSFCFRPLLIVGSTSLATSRWRSTALLCSGTSGSGLEWRTWTTRCVSWTVVLLETVSATYCTSVQTTALCHLWWGWFDDCVVCKFDLVARDDRPTVVSFTVQRIVHGRSGAVSMDLERYVNTSEPYHMTTSPRLSDTVWLWSMTKWHTSNGCAGSDALL